MQITAHTGPSFTVHMQGEPHHGFLVWVERHWPQGEDTALHMLEQFGGTPREQSRAENYALALAEAHGGCAVQMGG